MPAVLDALVPFIRDIPANGGCGRISRRRLTAPSRDVRTAAVTTDLELAILMALRVHGRGDATQVARATGCSETEAAAALAALQARGAVAPVANAAPARRLRRWSRSPTRGAPACRRLATEPLDRAALARLYDRFLVADRELKAAITAWQLAPPPTRRRRRTV